MRCVCRPSLVFCGARATTRWRGTSLIELLVVISVIALLVGILVPSLKRSMQMAQSTVCMHNLREIGHGLQLYRIEHKGWLPAVTPPQDSPVASTQAEVWFLKLYPTYLSDPLILTCPADPFRFRMVTACDRMDNPDIADYSSYGINSFIMTAGGGALANIDRVLPTRPLDTILIADLGPDNGYSSVADPDGSSHLTGPSRNSSLLAWDDGFDIFDGSSESWLTTRHGNGINILTLAGSVREARTIHTVQRPIERYYDDCAAGGCTLCRELELYHYSFARDRLYWWTGFAPESVVAGLGN